MSEAAFRSSLAPNKDDRSGLLLPKERKNADSSITLGNDPKMSADRKQIVILGGGFAGVYTARYLEKLLRPEEANITLVNRENYWVYQPMLSEVISGSIGLANVVSLPIRSRLLPPHQFW